MSAGSLRGHVSSSVGCTSGSTRARAGLAAPGPEGLPRESGCGIKKIFSEYVHAVSPVWPRVLH
eukprot:1493550-Prymnesium_polylepis.1